MEQKGEHEGGAQERKEKESLSFQHEARDGGARGQTAEQRGESAQDKERKREEKKTRVVCSICETRGRTVNGRKERQRGIDKDTWGAVITERRATRAYRR